MNEGYNVKRLISEYEIEIEGKLLLSPDEIVFEPTDENAEKIEIPTTKIKDARFATEKEIARALCPTCQEMLVLACV